MNNSSQMTAGTGAALLFAFLGGLILNLMPCVFPVLSLKLLGDPPVTMILRKRRRVVYADTASSRACGNARRMTSRAIISSSLVLITATLTSALSA